MKIKNLLLLLTVFAVSFTSCSKNENTKPEEETVEPGEDELTIVGKWEIYAFKQVRTIEGEEPVVLNDEVYKEFLGVMTFNADGTAIVKQYDRDTQEWEEVLHNYEAKDGVLKLVEDGEDENQSGYHTTGTYELTKDELILKMTVIEEYEGKKTTFDYTEKLRRLK